MNKLHREESILLSLKTLDYLTRRQIQRLHNLSGDRNARRVLTNMSPFISSFRGETGENIYYLNKEGRERVACEVVRTKSSQVNHFLMRNDVYTYYAPEEWNNEMKMNIKELQLTIIADAFFRHKGVRHFLEVDNLQTMQKNREKIERYKKLKSTNAVQQQYKLLYFPKLVWVTLTEGRKKQLSEWCDGLETVIHVWDEIK